jgi:hypothetical protein
MIVLYKIIYYIILYYIIIIYYYRYEAICVESGASECWTLEYNQLLWDHPQLHTIRVTEFEDGVKHGRVQLDFDHVWSFSALEHDGLGLFLCLVFSASFTGLFCVFYRSFLRLLPVFSASTTPDFSVPTTRKIWRSRVSECGHGHDAQNTVLSPSPKRDAAALCARRTGVVWCGVVWCGVVWCVW